MNAILKITMLALVTLGGAYVTYSHGKVAVKETKSYRNSRK